MNDVRALSPEPIKKSLGQKKTSNLFSERFASFLFFMFHYPYINLFLLTLTSRTFIALSSSHWLIIWMSLELNIISFIPLLASSNWFQESEATLKYLLFQAFGSTLILIRVFHPLFYTLALFGLLAKLGAAPFHFWFPSVIKRVPWSTAFLLITWQKIAPLILLIFSFSSQKQIILSVGIVSALVGGLGGLTQTHFRALLAYSSIGHMGWIIATASFSPFVSFIYLTFYIFISIPIIWASFITNIQSIKHVNTPHLITLSIITLPCVLSLSGLPPFIGFIPKLIALTTFSSIFVPLFLILGSLINLSYYLNFFFSFYISSHLLKYRTNFAHVPYPLAAFSWLACAPLPLIFFLLLAF